MTPVCNQNVAIRSISPTHKSIQLDHLHSKHKIQSKKIIYLQKTQTTKKKSKLILSLSKKKKFKNAS